MGPIEKQVAEWLRKLDVYRSQGQNVFGIIRNVFHNCSDDFERYSIDFSEQEHRLILIYFDAIWDFRIDELGRIYLNESELPQDEVLDRMQEIISNISLSIAQKTLTGE